MVDTRTHVRLASAKLGDDVSFSRYVKVKGPARLHGRRRNTKLPGFENTAIREGRTYFGKSVKTTSQMTNLLVSGHSNVKIGRDVRIGRHFGKRLFTLSFEERKTCPRSCHHWATCYGNAMPYAKRIDHTDPKMLPALEAEIDRLMAKRWAGVIIRLHALGDFYDVGYVGFWERMLTRHPKLVIFGYTAHPHTSEIGSAIDRLIDNYPDRAMMRFSNGGRATRSTVPIIDAESCPPGAFVCPEQTGQFDACGKCGACWTTLKNVAFMEH